MYWGIKHGTSKTKEKFLLMTRVLRHCRKRTLLECIVRGLQSVTIIVRAKLEHVSYSTVLWVVELKLFLPVDTERKSVARSDFKRVRSARAECNKATLYREDTRMVVCGPLITFRLQKLFEIFFDAVNSGMKLYIKVKKMITRAEEGLKLVLLAFPE